MVFSEFRRRFDVLAPHLTKKHGRNYIVVDEKRVGLGLRAPPDSPPSAQAPALPCLEGAGLALAQASGFGSRTGAHGSQAVAVGEGSQGYGLQESKSSTS